MIQETRGSVAIIFAISAPVLIALIGLTLDVGRGYVAAGSAQEALDRIAMTAAREYLTHRGQGDSGPESVARALWEANKPKGVGTALFFTSAQNTDGTWGYTVQANLAMPMNFLAIVPGVPSVWVIERSATASFMK